MKPLLVLRPEPGNAATAARARALGLDARTFPLFAIRPRAWEAADPSHYAGLLFTSANAVRHAGEKLAILLHLPVFAVGEPTAAAATAAGFASVVSGERDVAWIIAQIATLGPQAILHLSGEDTRAFDAMGLLIDRRIVYASESLPEPAGLRNVIAGEALALIHSPRAGARFAQLASDRSHIALVAISAAAAEAAGSGWQSIDIAPEPRDDAMLALALERC